MKAYVLTSNNMGVESVWKSGKDLLAALKDHLQSTDEIGLNLSVSIEDRPESEVETWGSIIDSDRSGGLKNGEFAGRKVVATV